MKRLIPIVFVIIQSLSSNCQNSQLVFDTSSWVVDKSHLVDDTLYTIGLGSTTREGKRLHHITFSKFTNNLRLIANFEIYHPDSLRAFSVYQNSGIEFTDSSIYIAGHVNGIGSDSTWPALIHISLEGKLLSYDTFNYDGQFYDLLLDSTGIYLLGAALDTSNGSRKLCTFLIAPDKNVTLYEFSNKASESGTYPISMLKIDGSLFILMETRPNNVALRGLDEGFLIQINDSGQIIWQKHFVHDSLGVNYSQMDEILDGKIIVGHTKRYWRPYHAPPDYRNPYPNKHESPFLDFMIIDPKNNHKTTTFTVRANQFQNIQTLYVQSINFDLSKVEKKLIVYGFTHIYTHQSYICKIDLSTLNPEWFKYLAIDSSGDRNRERTSISFLKQNTKGNILIGGEYFSYPTSIFTKGIQTGFIAYTDSVGCLTPGCKGFASIVGKREIVNVLRCYPNPTISGQVNVYIDYGHSYTIFLYDILGNLIGTKSDTGPTLHQYSSLLPGSYLVTVVSKDGDYKATQKVIVAN